MQIFILIFFLALFTNSKGQIALPTFDGAHKYHPPPNYAHSFDGEDDIISCGDITNLRRPGYFTVIF